MKETLRRIEQEDWEVIEDTIQRVKEKDWEIFEDEDGKEVMLRVLYRSHPYLSFAKSVSEEKHVVTNYYIHDKTVDSFSYRPLK